MPQTTHETDYHAYPINPAASDSARYGASRRLGDTVITCRVDENVLSFLKLIEIELLWDHSKMTLCHPKILIDVVSHDFDRPRRFID